MKFEILHGSKRLRVHMHRRTRGGVWHYCFCWKRERYRESTEHDDYEKACGAARRAVAEVMENAPTGPGLTLSEAIERYKKEKWPAQEGESFSDAHHRLKWFHKVVGEHVITHMSFDAATHLVQTFINKRQAGEHRPDGKKCGGRTIKGDQLVISAFYAWLIKVKDERGRRLVSWRTNPANDGLLMRPAVVTRVLPDVNTKNRKRFLTAARKHEVWPVVVLCLGAGFRPKGAAGLLWSALDLERGSVTVREKNVERAIPLAEWPWHELKAWRKKHPSAERLWPYHKDTAFDAVRELRRLNNIPEHVTLQALRRTADNALYDAGLMPQDAAGIMGHTPQTAERHYVHWKRRTDRSQVQALNFEKVPQKLPHRRKQIS